jgi:radical SAM protein with 4Fe4S-binding SPASM domain
MYSQQRVFFINVTKQCNLDCPRCYITEAHRKQPSTLPFDILHAAVDANAFPNSTATVIYQGGEPTLVGKETLTSYTDIVKQHWPNARQTMVTNCLTMHNWCIDLIHDAFDSQIETTFALGQKTLLNGNHERYVEAFITAMQKAHRQGVRCTINVELNPETLKAGPQALMEVVLASETRDVEFDLSVDFAAFHRQPAFSKKGYPTLPPTASYLDVSHYLDRFISECSERMIQHDIRSNFIDTVNGRTQNKAFNVQRESDFLTINHDGLVTTNPLFSDIPQTYIGNLNTESITDILHHPNRHRRIAAEIERLSACRDCAYLSACKGGPSHMPVTDGSGECANLHALWEKFYRL